VCSCLLRESKGNGEKYEKIQDKNVKTKGEFGNKIVGPG